MLGVVTVSINPLPVLYAITGGGDYCADGTGLAIGLSGSQIHVRYQLYSGVAATGGPQYGTGSAITFGTIPTAGTYFVTAVDTATGCSDTMLGTAHIVVNPLPGLFHVTGGGVYCTGDTGMHVRLSGSATGVNYQLYNGTSASGIPKLGTGSSLDFGLRAGDSTYYAIATDNTTGCSLRMLDTAVVTIQVYAVPTVTLTATPGTSISVGQVDTVTATVSGAGGTPTYKWRINRNAVPGATSNTLVFVMYFDDDTIDCDVTSVGLCGGIVTTKQIIIHLKVPSSVKQIVGTGSNIRLMPNPNKGNFDLKGSLGTATDEELYVEVVNMLGQTIYANKIMARNGEVDEHLELNGNLANGMYLLNLRSGTINSVYHFVIEQ
jgi:Secretion system C-terminal sorting domain/Ig-like domain CHU_C associated